MKISQLLLLIFLTFSFINTYGQTKKELENKRKKTLEDINFTNKLIEETKNNQDLSYNNLILINHKITVRRELIKDINREVLLVDEKIKEIEFVIGMMEDDLKRLSDNYARMIQAAWKNKNKQNEIMFILSSKDFNQTYMRLKYIQQFSEYRRRQLLAINSVKDILALNIDKLNESKVEKTLLLNTEKSEENNLKLEQKQQEKTLSSLIGQEKELQRKLQEQQKQMDQLKKEIEKIIAEEARKAAATSSTGKIALTPAEQLISTNFGNNMGRLPWPVERGVIVGHFGTHQHPVLKQIKVDNKGIDISTVEGAVVRAVFDGEVKKIVNIPGANTAVIVRHGEYLSAYTHLENVVVSVGQNITTKQIIGTVHTDKSENRTLLHFEIWKGSNTLDPAIWLAK